MCTAIRRARMMKKNKNKYDEEEGLKTVVIEQRWWIRNNHRFCKRVLKECSATVVIEQWNRIMNTTACIRFNVMIWRVFEEANVGGKGQNRSNWVKQKIICCRLMKTRSSWRSYLLRALVKPQQLIDFFFSKFFLLFNAASNENRSKWQAANKVFSTSDLIFLFPYIKLWLKIKKYIYNKNNNKKYKM